MEGAILLIMLGAAGGLGLSFLGMGVWNGAALLFGLPHPTGAEGLADFLYSPGQPCFGTNCGP